MKSGRSLFTLQIVATCLVTALGAIALVEGRIVVGLILFALAGVRVAIVVARRRRRAELARRFAAPVVRGRR